MFNPQLEELEWRKVYKGTHVSRENYSGIEWTETHLIDIKQGDLFKLVDPDGSPVEHEDGRQTFIANSDGYIGPLGIPAVEI